MTRLNLVLQEKISGYLKKSESARIIDSIPLNTGVEDPALRRSLREIKPLPEIDKTREALNKKSYDRVTQQVAEEVKEAGQALSEKVKQPDTFSNSKN